MDKSPNIDLPYIIAAQAQKHVTHNEAIRTLDALVQLFVLDRDLTTPPLSPTDGARYIVGPSATGDWSGKDNQIAAWQDSAWMFYSPAQGWLCRVNDEENLLVYNGTSWVTQSLAGSAGTSNTLNVSPFGAQTTLALQEEELTLLGPHVDSTIQIPDRAIVFGVSTRTTQAIIGASSYDCGIASETGKYGGSLGISLDSTNSGVTGPTAFYADTPVRLTANGADFTAGKVRITLHYVLCTPPTS